MFDTLKVAKRIRDGRNAKNMTQMELADKLGVSFQAVSNWERGASMPDISKLSDLSEILSISISELLGSEDKSSISVSSDFFSTLVTSISSPAKNSFRLMPNISHNSKYTDTSGKQIPVSHS